MGWDVLVLNLDRSITSLVGLPNDFVPPPVGPADQTRARISDAFPSTDWSDPSWGLWSNLDYALEFSVGRAAHVDSFMIHVHGSGDPVTPILAMCRRFGWQAFDTSLGDLIDLDNPASSAWEAFKSWRDRVLSEPP